MAHIHIVRDSNAHFKIDPVTREIINVSKVETRLMQGDHNSERVTFEIPHFVEEHDMSLSDKIEIHFTNIDSKTNAKSEDVYTVSDMATGKDEAGNDIVIFSWLIASSATKYAGILTFRIGFTCLTGETIDYLWHTAIYDGIPVGSGIYNSEAVITKYSDVIERLRGELDITEIQRIAELITDTQGELEEVKALPGVVETVSSEVAQLSTDTQASLEQTAAAIEANTSAIEANTSAIEANEAATAENKAALDSLTTENWTFTLENGDTVTKAVYVG